jgi:hypothetical protein
VVLELVVGDVFVVLVELVTVEVTVATSTCAALL